MHHFNDIPLEIIAEFYKYLDFKDVKAAALTCHQWLKAFEYAGFENRIVLKLTSLNKSIQELFERSSRKYTFIHLIVIRSCLMNDRDLILFFSMPNIKRNLKCLVLEDLGSISFETSCQILSLLSELTELKCINTSFDRFNETLDTHPSEAKLLKYSETISSCISSKLEALVLQSNYSTDLNLKLFARIRNLKKLNLYFITLDNTAISSFYQIIKNNEKSLKYLSLKLNKFNKHFVKSLFLIPHLKLSEIDLTFQSRWTEIGSFFKTQNTITNLNLTDCLNLNDINIIEILNNLPLLEVLNLAGSSKLTDKTLVEISKLKCLKCLNINSTSFTTAGLLNFAENINTTITELKCLKVDLNDEAFIKLSKKLLNLQVLHCGCSTINDIAIQSIIENCKNLLDLNIFSSYNITDYGLTGLDLKTKVKKGSSISELKKLKSLNLRRCINITDQTLIHGLKFENLNIIYLPSCYPGLPNMPWLKMRKVSLDGFRIFTKNCPKIKELNLLGCSGNENLDQAIEIAMNNLPELQRMSIARHCEKESQNQWAYLFKFRKDLSKINFICDCNICLNIKKLCLGFFN